MKDDLEAQAQELVRELFIDGAGRRARRLVMEYADGPDVPGAGWAEGPVRDRVRAALEAERERCASACEEVATMAADERALMAACACSDRIRGAGPAPPTRSVKLERDDG